jgi:hypothetical protein
MEADMKRRRIVYRLWAAGWCLAGVLAVSSCEDAETRSAIEIAPESVNLVGGGALATFTATTVFDPDSTNRNEELVYPLVWRVSNPALGGILESRGNAAVYESNGQSGQNVVIVRDGFGREGLASVYQRPR